jgi:hypothetical protein
MLLPQKHVYGRSPMAPVVAPSDACGDAMIQHLAGQLSRNDRVASGSYAATESRRWADNSQRTSPIRARRDTPGRSLETVEQRLPVGGECKSFDQMFLGAGLFLAAAAHGGTGQDHRSRFAGAGALRRDAGGARGTRAPPEAGLAVRQLDPHSPLPWGSMPSSG